MKAARIVLDVDDIPKLIASLQVAQNRYLGTGAVELVVNEDKLDAELYVEKQQVQLGEPIDLLHVWVKE
jgi:hypothetical protein